MPDKVSQRTILHSDMNAFYASVAMMLDPTLKGKAVAVCGDVENRHGIVLAKSQLAKSFGVKTGMANWEARERCPGLIIVPPQYDEYLKYSHLAHNIYHDYTDLIEPFGMDECWLDITATQGCNDGMSVAEEIRNRVKEELGLTVSIGVSFNKIFAKLGSDMKKPDAITQITQENFREKVWPLPVEDLLYVGYATTRKLARYGIRTIGQLAATDPEVLRLWFGINGIKLWTFAAGKDNSRVMQMDYVFPVKSVGHGITCITDLINEEEVYKVLLELSQDLGHRLRLHGLTARGVQVTARSNDLSFHQYQAQLELPTQLPCEFTNAAFELLKGHYNWQHHIRALTIRAIDLQPSNTPEQLSMAVDWKRRDRRIRLEDTVEETRRRFGKQSLTYAILLGDLKMPSDGRDKVRMPSPMFQ